MSIPWWLQYSQDMGHIYLQSFCNMKTPLVICGTSLDNFNFPDTGLHKHILENIHETFGLRFKKLALTTNTTDTSMNTQQSGVFETIYTTISDPQCQNLIFYPDGAASCSKSFISLALCTKHSSEPSIPVTANTTPLSVTMSQRGQTAHSAFGIRVNYVHLSALFPSLHQLHYQHNSEILSNVKPYSQCNPYLAVTDLIIWEEMPLAYRLALECIDKLFKGIIGNNSTFGGNMILGMGDFPQSAPGFRFGGNTQRIDDSTAPYSPWHSFSLLHL